MARLATICLVLGYLIPVLGAVEPAGQILDVILVENFDNDGSTVYPKGSFGPDGESIDDAPVVWGVQGSRYRSEGYPKMTYVDRNWPFGLYGINPENADQLKVLGVRAKFDKLGYNSFSISPGVGEGDDWQPAPLPLTSKDMPEPVRSFSVWVWGGGFNYSITLVIQDYRGFLHSLPLQPTQGPKNLTSPNLNFRGWQRMIAVVPKEIRQASGYNLQETRISIVKFLVHTSPDERVDDFFVYLDNLRMAIEAEKSNYYDGRELSERSIIDGIWVDEGTTEAPAAANEGENNG